jgi:hypothetical protein
MHDQVSTLIEMITRSRYTDLTVFLKIANSLKPFVNGIFNPPLRREVARGVAAAEDAQYHHGKKSVSCSGAVTQGTKTDAYRCRLGPKRTMATIQIM